MSAGELKPDHLFLMASKSEMIGDESAAWIRPRIVG